MLIPLLCKIPSQCKNYHNSLFLLQNPINIQANTRLKNHVDFMFKINGGLVSDTKSGDISEQKYC